MAINTNWSFHIYKLGQKVISDLKLVKQRI